MGNANGNGKIGFLDNNKKELESIQMKQTENGEWMTTNQAIFSSNANKYVVHAVNCRSDQIKARDIII